MIWEHEDLQTIHLEQLALKLVDSDWLDFVRIGLRLVGVVPIGLDRKDLSNK